ncbi:MULTISPECIES: polysaccharide pyruvyl transferase family protein [unclassified Pseudoclavibacter]|uniref:polysaccharide pyruvyl transferase family protein n=1 Tax=unclassified Pseudoclavibacter TaxID=2615177 RepID=UPI001BA601AF|nr:polysaccharide pyruvyl transferase family protein [Pseudoclavibacter sp. Marseille-Q4354]MBS3180069.1 polysaccharide pyruvyl transferase family protein [Pseudoclavibacter sp. Marseille-Q4354]
MPLVYSWNPRRPLLPGRLSKYSRFGRRVNNFGDLLGGKIVEAVIQRRHLGESSPTSPGQQLLSIGSVLHEARDGDVVWGSGRNGKKTSEQHSFDSLDVRAVRGPLTRAFLEGRGIHVPEIYGDPALLLPTLYPETVEWAANKRRKYAVVPNFNEWDAYRDAPNVVDPLGPISSVIEFIASSEYVVGSSLHGVIVAEALGIPAVAIASRVEPDFKYRDYHSGTGRPPESLVLAEDLDSGLRAAAKLPPPILDWSPDLLLDAFPSELWQPSTHESEPPRL